MDALVKGLGGEKTRWTEMSAEQCYWRYCVVAGVIAYMVPSLVNCCTIDWFTEWPAGSSCS